MRSLGKKEIQRALSGGYSHGGEQVGIKRPVSADNPPQEEWEVGAGRGAMRESCLQCHGKQTLLVFSFSRQGDANPSVALQTVWHTGRGRKTFGKITALSLQRGNNQVCILCASVSKRKRERVPIWNCLRLSDVRCVWSIIGGLRQPTMSKSHKMAAV